MCKQVILIIAALALAACSDHAAPTLTPEDARKELGKLNVTYSEQAFIDAARNGDSFAVNFFLTAGMDPNVKDPQGRLAYSFVEVEPLGIMSSQIRVSEDLISRGYIKPAGGGGTALMAAAIMGRTEIIRALLAKGADVNVKDRIGLTALVYATWKNHADTVTTLIDAGANVDGVEKALSPLMIAASYNHKDVASALIGKGADVNRGDAVGGTALMEAAQQGSIEVVNMLVDHGADVNARDQGGETALIKLSRSSAPAQIVVAIAQKLISKGADVNAKNSNQTTALKIAGSKYLYSKPELAQVLKQAGAKE